MKERGNHSFLWFQNATLAFSSRGYLKIEASPNIFAKMSACTSFLQTHELLCTLYKVRTGETNGVYLPTHKLKPVLTAEPEVINYAYLIWHWVGPK